MKGAAIRLRPRWLLQSLKATWNDGHSSKPRKSRSLTDAFDLRGHMGDEPYKITSLPTL